jgi:CheY-like chemotaxis protein
VEPLQIERDPELPQGHYVAIHVTDTGAGMTPEVAERAFEPFFTTKGLGKGTGLGLSQVYAMARQAGGAVRIETAPGQGTTVRILLHQATEAADDGLPLIDGVRRPVLPASDATILVIDDDDAVRRSLVESVEALGFRAIEASDGTSGLAALEQAPDLMMVDFAMPGMNGAEVAHAARIRRPELPIILVTGYADTAALTAAVEAGSVVLRKPVELDELEATLRDRLKTRTGAGR